jgi:phosphoglycolate phosphatase
VKPCHLVRLARQICRIVENAFAASNSSVQSPAQPAALALLRALRGRGILTGIVSTKFRYRIQEILRRAELVSLVDAIVGGEDIATAKPHPEGILAALAALRVGARSALYIGDHYLDALAARAADVDFTAVLTGTTDRATFAAHHVAVEDSLPLPTGRQVI